MSIEIEVLNGDASWPLAEPLFKAVWPPDVVAKLPWAGIVFAHADLRVLVQDETEDVLCHVGIYRREITWNGRKLRAGGIGGVMTREDSRRRGYASIALNAAIQTLKHEGATDFALLFCEPHNRAVLHRPRLETVRGRDLCRTARRAGSLRRHRALCLPPQAHAAARRHRPVRPALVTGEMTREGTIIRDRRVPRAQKCGVAQT